MKARLWVNNTIWPGLEGGGRGGKGHGLCCTIHNCAGWHGATAAVHIRQHRQSQRCMPYTEVREAANRSASGYLLPSIQSSTVQVLTCLAAKPSSPPPTRCGGPYPVAHAKAGIEVEETVKLKLLS